MYSMCARMEYTYIQVYSYMTSFTLNSIVSKISIKVKVIPCFKIEVYEDNHCSIVLTDVGYRHYCFLNY